ncbi:hypothetical protein CsatB_007483 [Cannabis sativa]
MRPFLSFLIKKAMEIHCDGYFSPLEIQAPVNVEKCRCEILLVITMAFTWFWYRVNSMCIASILAKLIITITNVFLFF